MSRGSAALTFLLLGAVGGGCRAPGRIELSSLNYRAVDPPAPRAAVVNARRCYWWEDDAGRVCIAAERVDRFWFSPKTPFRFGLSLVLGPPPAGREREYAANARTLRAVVRLGPAEARFVSSVGIAAVKRRERDRLECSFRLLASREVFQFLTWSRPARYLIQGKLVAVHDEERGRQILKATESAGWQRDPAADQAEPPGPPA